MDENPVAQAVSVRDRLKQIAAELRNGETAPALTVRAFLLLFGWYRRGHWVVRSIRGELKEAGLRTVPDFETVYIDSYIGFALAPAGTEASIPSGTSTSVADAVLVTEEQQATVSIGIGDPTYRISKLGAANMAPVFVSPDRPVTDAVTLMLSHDFSQLPVMTSERVVKGMISWRAIGGRLALEREGGTIRDFMEEAFEIGADRSVFAAIPTIVEQGYVLVRDSTGRISGIITTADLSMQFKQLAEPYLLLGEIENHVRRLMDGRFTKEELTQARDPTDATRQIENVSNLSFGELIRMLQQPTLWDRLGLAIDRVMFVKDLDDVRGIRNDVMHFDPDPLPEIHLMTLRRIVKFLQTMQSLGA